MLRKLMSFVLCFAIAFAAVSGAGFGGNAVINAAVTAEAAEFGESMLPYFYYQLSKKEQREYIRLRKAMIDMEPSLKVQLDSKSMEKIINILYMSDVLTSFNILTAEWLYNPWTGLTDKVNIDYNFTKKDYNTIIRKADEYADKVISGFTSKMDDYEKIKYIHDYIIDRCEYNTSGSTANSIYGALVRKSAKCDGYAHAFNYICTKAGIGVITICGKEAAAAEDSYHAWNKVMYDRKWYNVDVTWDDPVGNIKDNKCYTYFMVSDEAIKATHIETDFGYDVPRAPDDSMNYYKNNKLIADSRSSARSILSKEIAKAAKNGKSVVSIRFSDAETAALMKDPAFLSEVLEAADKKAGEDIVTSCWQIGFTSRSMNIYTMMFFRPGTKLSDYYKDIEKLDDGTVKYLSKLGIKNK